MGDDLAAIPGTYEDLVRLQESLQRRGNMREPVSDTHQDPSVGSTDALPGSGRGEDAVFMGWQTTRVGGPLALYNITAEGHPSFGSTVTGKSLRKLNLEIPITPPPQPPVKNM